MIANKTIVDTHVNKYFKEHNNALVQEIDRKLKRALKKSLYESGIRIDSDLISFGSTEKNTFLLDDLDFDYAAILSEDAYTNLNTDIKSFELLIAQAIKNVENEGFKINRVIDYEDIFKRYWFKISLYDIDFRFTNLKIKNVDIIFIFPQNYNIGLINYNVITSILKRIENELGMDVKNEILSHIRFTKWLSKQDMNLINEKGEFIYPEQKTKISENGGFTSILIEHSLLQLCKNDNSIYTKAAQFDDLMNFIYTVDKTYRSELKSKNFIPLEVAQETPMIINLKRVEVVEAMANLKEQNPQLENVDIEPSIFRLIHDESKWFLLVQLARDYIEAANFKEKYLSK